jgi:hypothetical protein
LSSRPVKIKEALFGGGWYGVRESNGRAGLTQVKYTHSEDTSRNPFEH